MPRPSSDWPEPAVPHVHAIEKENNTLHAIAQVLITEGIDNHNYGLIALFLPKMQRRATIIKTAARQITRQIQKRGRIPRWGNLAMDIIVLADEQEQIIRMIKKNLPSNRYLTISFLLDKARAHAEKITDHLETLNYPAQITVPEVFEEAFYDDD